MVKKSQNVKKRGERMNKTKIKNRMMQMGVKQKDLAMCLGIGASTISQKLNNERKLTISEARRLQLYLQIPDDEFCQYFFDDLVA